MNLRYTIVAQCSKRLHTHVWLFIDLLFSQAYCTGPASRRYLWQHWHVTAGSTAGQAVQIRGKNAIAGCHNIGGY